jgi:hypothetical protein
MGQGTLFEDHFLTEVHFQKEYTLVSSKKPHRSSSTTKIIFFVRPFEPIHPSTHSSNKECPSHPFSQRYIHTYSAYIHTKHFIRLLNISTEKKGDHYSSFSTVFFPRSTFHLPLSTTPPFFKFPCRAFCTLSASSNDEEVCRT